MTEIRETLKGSSAKIFGTASQKNSTDRDTPNIKKILIQERIWNSEGFHYEYFWYSEP